MALGTAHQTVTTAANFIPEIWSKDVQVATEAKLVMADKVLRFDQDVVGRGDTIHIPNVSNLSATAKVAETQVTLQSPTEGVTDISIDKHFETSFLVEDITGIQSAYVA